MNGYSGVNMSCKMVRFYYGDYGSDGDLNTFRKMAYDDYFEAEVEDHEKLLQKEGIHYLKVEL